jgi:prolyl oligopeptidase
MTDTLHFDKLTGGKLWVDEYGDPAREADCRTAIKYSP